ncbi:MAG: magnesium transporter, partial [Gammaproteobacteria bacterium]
MGRQETPRRELVQNLLQRQQSAELRRKLLRLHPADIAYVLENLPPGKRQALWGLLADTERGAVLLELADAVRVSLVGAMAAGEIAELAAHLEPAQISELVPKLPREQALELLNALDQRNLKNIQSALPFPRGSVGALMEFDMVTLRMEMTVNEVLQHFRTLEKLPENADQVFVLDQGGTLQGVLSIRDLIRSRPETPIRDLLDADAIAFHTDDSARDVVNVFERYDLLSAPVVNLHNQLLGVINIDRVIDFKEELSQKERLNQVGLSEDEDLFAPIWHSARNRWVWLGLNLTTAFIASRVIGRFEDTISQIVALAALMPIVASIGGNTGNQTVALMIRGITLRQITRANFRRFLVKEMGISLINGTLWGAVMGTVAFLLYFQAGISLVM